MDDNEIWIDDEHPAFPVETKDEFGATTYYRGLSIRDYFAAEAMKAFIIATSDHSGTHPQNDAIVAERAYDMAEAMIEERSKV